MRISFDRFVNLRLLLSVEGIGPLKLRNLLSKFKSLEKILNSSTTSLIQAEGIDKILATRISNIRLTKNKLQINLEKEYDQLLKIGGSVLTVWDTEYPELLKKIYDPPLILYIKGKYSEFDKFALSIVGTRTPTAYGKNQAERFSSEFAKQNIPIVSGLARGIDSIAHKSTLRINGRTIAILGTGLDVIYPPENKKLFDEISEKGLIISEYPLGTKPDAQNFPKRNRIISGLTLGTLVIETALNGGAMQTASFALDQNREVFAIPGNIDVKQSEGTNLLIQKGEAKLVLNPEDILQELELKLKPVIGKNIPKPSIELSIFEDKIISNLTNTPIQIDKISELTSMSTSDCLVHLLSLEFKGLVTQLPGKMFALI
ncbi:MAG: DNA-processing protein DprA [Ignavibacteriales bacterium]|nr:DNA-processing protein DprA [Ignavibacteriales bacterium]